MKTYEVMRDHYGDRMYRRGDDRVADENAVATLLASGVLREKAAEKPKNKAAPKVKNKAAD